MKKRRRILVPINPSVFQYFFKQGIFRVEESPIPKDAKYIGVRYDWQVDRFLVCFEHKSFEPIPEGMCLPIIDLLRINMK